MCLLHAIRPPRSDQNVSVTAVSMMSLLGLSASGSCR
jgi:hypothetical protein